jgi:hypothetical protein
MAKILAFDAIRIIPRETAFLDRRAGARGEIFYDREANTLRLYNGDILSGIPLAKADLTNISNAVFLAKATALGFLGFLFFTGVTVTVVSVLVFFGDGFFSDFNFFNFIKFFAFLLLFLPK